MNTEFKNIRNNEWVITNDKGEMRLIKASDISNEEVKKILLKENELEFLINEKDSLLQKIDKINDATKMAQKGNRLFSALIATIGVTGLGFLFISGFNLDNILILLVSASVPTLLCVSCKIGLLSSFGSKHIREEIRSDFEESLAELKEKEPELIEEINMLKERDNFKEEVKEVNYLEDLRYENNHEKKLVRARVRN